MRTTVITGLSTCLETCLMAGARASVRGLGALVTLMTILVRLQWLV